MEWSPGGGRDNLQQSPYTDPLSMSNSPLLGSRGLAHMNSGASSGVGSSVGSSAGAGGVAGWHQAGVPVITSSSQQQHIGGGGGSRNDVDPFLPSSVTNANPLHHPHHAGSLRNVGTAAPGSAGQPPYGSMDQRKLPLNGPTDVHNHNGPVSSMPPHQYHNDLHGYGASSQNPDGLPPPPPVPSGPAPRPRKGREGLLLEMLRRPAVDREKEDEYSLQRALAEIAVSPAEAGGEVAPPQLSPKHTGECGAFRFD